MILNLANRLTSGSEILARTKNISGKGVGPSLDLMGLEVFVKCLHGKAKQQVFPCELCSTTSTVLHMEVFSLFWKKQDLLLNVDTFSIILDLVEQQHRELGRSGSTLPFLAYPYHREGLWRALYSQ